MHGTIDHGCCGLEHLDMCMKNCLQFFGYYSGIVTLTFFTLYQVAAAC